MNNLIKNELTKITHKKALYVLGIITIILAFINFIIFKNADNKKIQVESDKAVYKSLEEELKDYDLSKPEEAKWYVENLTDLELYKASTKYDYDGWQYSMIREQGYDDVYCRNEAKYIKKDNEKYEECNNNFNKFLDEIDSHDWQYFVKAQIEEKETEIKSLKLALDELTNESDKYNTEIAIKRVEYELEGLKYRIDKNIPPDNNNSSALINEYVVSATEYLEMNKDEDSYADHSLLVQKRQIEESYYLSKYKLENNITTDSFIPANETLATDFSMPITFVFVAIIMVAGTIVAEEFNKGTIKQLLLKPYSRNKILLSKYIASLIVFAVYLLFFFVVDCLMYGFALGFENLFDPIIVYSFSSHSVIKMNIFAAIGLNLLAVLPVYLILLSLAFFASTVTNNSGLSITIPLLVYFFSSIINMLIVSNNVKILSIFPTMCWDFTEYLYGGIPSFKYANFGVSLCISILVFSVLVIGSFIVFKRKNIKNQ